MNANFARQLTSPELEACWEEWSESENEEQELRVQYLWGSATYEMIPMKFA